MYPKDLTGICNGDAQGIDTDRREDDPENEPETAPYEEEEQGDGSEGSEEYDAGSGSTQGV